MNPTESAKAYPERPLYPGEIARTEQKYAPWKKHSPFGNTHPNTCGMTQCRYCANEDTQRIIQPYDLQPFVAYYGHQNFLVYSCYLCGGLWHCELSPAVQPRTRPSETEGRAKEKSAPLRRREMPDKKK